MDAISHRFVTTNGIRMHIAEQGEGPRQSGSHRQPSNHPASTCSPASVRHTAVDQTKHNQCLSASGEGGAAPHADDSRLMRIAGGTISLHHGFGAVSQCRPTASASRINRHLQLPLGLMLILHFDVRHLLHQKFFPERNPCVRGRRPANRTVCNC